ncbi:MAG: type II secretion system F family protein [Thermaerobacter sp.]|nr:type II secretion system F family protein [Thermaerobacter sp.]
MDQIFWGVVVAWVATLVAVVVWRRDVAGVHSVRHHLYGLTGTTADSGSFIRRVTGKTRGRWARRPTAASLRLRMSEYGLIRVGSVLVPGLAGFLVRGPIGGLLLAVVGFVAVTLFLRYKQSSWLRSIEKDLPDFLRGVAGAMRAGISFQQAMVAVGRETPGPLGLEVVRMMRRETLGYTMEQVLTEFAERVPSRDIELAVTAILIQREIGGALSAILENIVTTMSERQRVKHEVKTLTAQGRMSGWVLTMLPVGVGIMVWFTNPHYLSPLFHTTIGLMMAGTGLVSLAIGTFVIQKMVGSIEVD